MNPVTPYDDDRDPGDSGPRDTEPTRPLSQQPSAAQQPAEPPGRSWLPPLPARPGGRYDGAQPSSSTTARDPHGRVPWWMWAIVCGLALSLGLFGGAVGSL